MTPKKSIDSLCCLNTECKEYGQTGRKNLSVRKIYGKDNIRYLRCHFCCQEFSERKGTGLFNLKIREEKAVSVIEHLDSGCGVVNTCRLVGVSKETVRRLIMTVGKSSMDIHNILVRNVNATALQFDEKWSFTGKKKANIKPEDEEGSNGDRWDINGIDPVSKLLLTLISGPRTAENIHAAVKDSFSRLSTESGIPPIFTDGEVSYVEAIKQTFGKVYPVSRKSIYGPTPSPIIRVPHNLVYAQIIKHRQGGKIKHVEIRPIFGKGKLEQVVQSLGWNKPNTSSIERFNLTDRSRNRRKVRKTLSFSKKQSYHDSMSWINSVLYNFYHTQRGLGQPWERKTPAMASGIADHRYSTLELLRLCPISPT